MAGILGKRWWLRRAGLAVMLAALASAGCTSGGTQFTLFPQREVLTDSARMLRAASGPHPLPLPRELDQRVLPAYVVEPGDVLLVQPADLDSPVQIPGDQPVLLDGTIHLGRYGQVVVAGKTVPQIEQLVRSTIQAHVKDVGPIVVRIVTRLSKVYYVLGEVNAPGAFPLQGRETVLDGIIAAGGLTDRASRRNIILSRPTGPNHCRIVLPVCYRDIVQIGDTTTNYQLAPGDRIFVPGRTLFEDLCPRRQECPPCGGPHAPCDLGGHALDVPHAPVEAPVPSGALMLPPVGQIVPPAGAGQTATPVARLDVVAQTGVKAAPAAQVTYPAYGRPEHHPAPPVCTEEFPRNASLRAP